jgi:transaldolase
MKFFIDSAIIEEIRSAAQWGWVAGVTTNPKLLSISPISPQETLRSIAETIEGPVYYQLFSDTTKKMVEEAQLAAEILGDRLVLKIPACKTGFESCALLFDQFKVCITSVYSASQAMVANAAGAHSVVIYYNRAISLMENGTQMIQSVVKSLSGSNTQVIAASLKSVDQVINARLMGIETQTLPYELLLNLTTHELSEDTIKEFQQTGVGITLEE